MAIAIIPIGGRFGLKLEKHSRVPKKGGNMADPGQST